MECFVNGLVSTLLAEELEKYSTQLCKILCFRGGDYEEFCLVGYKNPVRTSQGTHYVFATETSRLMVCKI
jgi:hypothetical protein